MGRHRLQHREGRLLLAWCRLGNRPDFPTKWCDYLLSDDSGRDLEDAPLELRVLLLKGRNVPQPVLSECRLSRLELLNRPFLGSSVLRRLILIPWVMPLVITGTMFYLVFQTTNGLANAILQGAGLIHAPVGWLTSGTLAVTAIVIANIWAGVPFNAVLLYSGLQDVPQEQLEAAAVDGANAWQRFRRVTVPAMRPVILIVLMLGIVYTAKVFDLVIVLTNGGPANESQLMSSWAYTQAFGQFNFGAGSAIGNMLLVFCFVIGLLYLWMSRGEAAGGRV